MPLHKLKPTISVACSSGVKINPTDGPLRSHYSQSMGSMQGVHLVGSFQNLKTEAAPAAETVCFNYHSEKKGDCFRIQNPIIKALQNYPYSVLQVLQSCATATCIHCCQLV